ncbi:MAG: hypothetical protein FJ279_17800 [Planctomycetes bacterium]|nr:hypothetical protein [Planctomycetota bacterium]
MKTKSSVGKVSVLAIGALAVLTGLAAGRGVFTNGHSATDAAALTCASAGLNKAFVQLKLDPGWRKALTGETEGGAYAVTVADVGKDVVQVCSTGIANGVTRSIRVIVELSERPLEPESKTVHLAMVGGTWQEY